MYFMLADVDSVYSRAVESVHKISDSDSSIFKTSDSDSSIFKIPTPTPSQKLNMY
jgi:hypothetical protein